MTDPDLPPRPSGMTVQLQVDDLTAARDFFGLLLGSAAEFEPHEDFLEWRVVPGSEVWIQVVGVRTVQPLGTRLRVRVDDVHAARARLLAAGVDTVGEVTTLPGVVRWIDVRDPWGNPLGCYEDLAPSAGVPGPGGSVHDPAQFRTEP